MTSKVLQLIALVLTIGTQSACAQGFFGRRRSSGPTPPPTPSPYYRRRSSPTPPPTPTPSPSPTPPVDLQTKLQQQLDALIEHYSNYFPDLAMSVAYTDRSHDVSVASGKASGRTITPTDTFLYGSGTKPFTATAVFRLIDAGKLKADDRVSDIVDPYLKAHGQPSLAHFFGESVGTATVLELVRMGAGIRDFEDDFSFDQWVLAPENSSKFWQYPYDAMEFAASTQNTKGAGPLYCNPGNCTAYSSTSYEVAGLVLAATLNPQGDWYDFDLGSALFANRSTFPSMSFPPRGKSSSKLSNFLTVPGHSTANTWPKTTIYDQDPSILGWTCGNLVASPRDVAKFFYHVLDDTVESDINLMDSSRKEMKNFQTLTTGWNAGKLKYGAGLMELAYGHTRRLPVQGHEGDTYGFLSSQGYVPTLNGGYSIASNVDDPHPMETMACYLLQSVNEAVTGDTKGLGCSLADPTDSIVV